MSQILNNNKNIEHISNLRWFSKSITKNKALSVLPKSEHYIPRLFLLEDTADFNNV